MRSCVYFVAILCLLASTAMADGQKPEQSAEAKEQAASGTLVITPVENCLAQLDKADADDVRRNYSQPYRECLRRSKVKTAKDNSLNVTAAPPKDEAPKEKEEENKFKFNLDFKITPRASELNQ